MSEFRPPRWLASPHLQTIGAAIPIHSSARVPDGAHEEELRIPVGPDPQHALHARAWWRSGRGPTALLLHGIAGSKDSLCCVRAAVALARAGHHVVRLDMRGAGDSLVSAPSLYHAGLTADLDAAVAHLAKDGRVDGLVVLGFSGGGTQALKLAGEWGGAPPPAVRAVVTVSAPLDYTRVVAHMDAFARLPYRFHVLRNLVERARAFAKLHPARAHYSERDLERIRRFRDYDREIILPMHGFDDVDDYYRAASAGPLLDRVAVPALLLHAEDDPMVLVSDVRPWAERASSAVTLRTTARGGHLGWLGGATQESWVESWSTRQALAFFEEHR